MIKFNALLEIVLAGGSLNTVQMTEIMDAVMTGELTKSQLAAFLIALRNKGETADEITAAAMTVRKFATQITSTVTDLVDTCGTGGDGMGTFNISTASAIVAAAAGVKIAKHGNRSVSSNSGSADFLQLAGVDLTLNAEQVASCVEQIGIGFLFAPQFHSAMKFAAPVRKEIGGRTIFNLLGPLTNPLGAKTQLIGVYSARWLEPMAHAVKQLGIKRAMVVHGEDGLDEISINAPTQVIELDNDTFRSYRILPADFALEPTAPEAICAADAAASRAMIYDVFQGKKGAAHDIVVLNAAAAIYLGALAPDLAQAMIKAQVAIGSGAAADTLETLVTTTQALAKTA